MLPKHKKVQRKDFPGNKDLGASYYSPRITLRVSAGKKNIKSKVSFVVSSRISKKAVERNKLKRRAYNIVSKNNKLILEKGIYIFFFKKESVQATYEQLQNEITLLLKKAKNGK